MAGDGFGKSLDASGRNPRAAGAEFFQVVTKQRGAGGEVVVPLMSTPVTANRNADVFRMVPQGRGLLTGSLI